MDSLLKEGAARTPSVNFNADQGHFRIQGRSTPDDAIEFYAPLFEYMKKYNPALDKKTEVHIYLEYFNTSSSKCLFDLFKMLSNIHDRGNEVTVAWYYVEGDDDMLETGQDFESLSNLPFKMIIAPKISFD
ncbi:MAG: hypothetical protein A2275_14280 [Bacteroidetes bacterium RIFOXYA12_FULL_35_11]|nr:MAG: hypothetical protein A2X01_12320 [Bacteroidetes bacterium GWF2_35_48]OFY76479.1 MAG: hypothetical protein A2275_14280 [Bacteroidetes bacterium RIFOXYA12_FULL_35_11]OFY95170.1 MAG: hypothetical protein A2309_05340 [Bacteroidetes bacterium RIFOXYB2_FULL_35_7]OFZ01959.1 MAG: hypothetical protein A2491_19795 [Bacteroidetes bacterium RIFOXYC12_FULL_35_7]HBX51088.1 nuclear pore complex subunit [Bacteroidales bacterium]